jgi:hypothetical protein
MTDTYELFVWHRYATDNLARLTAVLAPKILGKLANVEGELCRLRDGIPAPIKKEDMREIMNRFIRTPKVVDRGTAAEPDVEMTFETFKFPMAGAKHDLGFEPNDRVLVDLIGALLPHVACAPRRPLALKPQQLEMIKLRLKSGEPAYLIADSFHASIDQIKEIGAREGIHTH